MEASFMRDATSQTIYFYNRHPISCEMILAKLRASRGHLDELRPEELFPHDQDHYGGLAATDELAREAQVRNGSRVADFCAGLGGTVRYLAHKYGADVTGIELTPARVSGAQELSSSSMVGQQMAVSFGIKLDDSLVNGAVEVIRAGEGLMSEVMPLQVAPDPFNIVQLRGVFRQPLDREPVGARGEGSAACLTRVDRAVVEDKHDGLEHYPELGTIAPINLLQQSNEVRASFGPAGAHDELATSPIEHAEHRYFGALARGRNAQVGPLLGPDVRQIRMGERLGLVREQKHDVARLSLGREPLSASARPVHRI